MTRLTSMISFPMCLLLGVLFFLPWLEVSCDTSMAKGMGQQMSAGMKNQPSNAQPGEAMAKTMADETAKAADKMPSKIVLTKASGFNLATGSLMVKKPSGPGSTDNDSSDSPKSVDIDSRFWVWGGLLLPILILIGAVMGMRGKAPLLVGIIVLAGAILGVILCTQAAEIDLGSDILKADQKMKNSSAAPPNKNVMQGAEMMGGAMFDTTPQIALAVSKWGYIVLIVFGAIQFIPLLQKKTTAPEANPAP